MTEVSASLVKELRDRTGVGMMACKKALEESNGDITKAIEILRKRGEAKAAEKADRSTKEGCIAIAGRAILKLLCETDFVAKNELFTAFAQEIAQKADTEGKEKAVALFESIKTDKIQAIGENIVLDDIQTISGGNTVAGYVHSNGKLGCLVALEGGDKDKAKDAAMQAVAMNPLVANPEEVPAEEIAKEKEIYKAQLKNEGKPENIIDKIVEGKIKKFCAEKALSSQPFVKDPSMTVAQYLGSAKIVKFIRIEV